MSSVKPGSPEEQYVYVDLDEPTRWWSALVGVIVVALVMVVLVAPWMIELEDEAAAVASGSVQNANTLCRPDANGLPSVLDPTVASWGRFCDWFIAPNLESPNGQ